MSTMSNGNRKNLEGQKALVTGATPARLGARARARARNIAIIRSLEPGEDWNCCCVDEVAFLVDGIRGETRIPPSPLVQ
jgi:hypothetical protein